MARFSPAFAREELIPEIENNCKKYQIDPCLVENFQTYKFAENSLYFHHDYAYADIPAGQDYDVIARISKGVIGKDSPYRQSDVVRRCVKRVSVSRRLPETNHERGAFMSGFMTYWSKDYIKGLKKAGDHGAISVIFGSHHTKMPSISSVKVGDVIYPVTLSEGTLMVLAKLPVEKIEGAFDYLIRETGQIHGALVPDGYALEHEYNAGGIFYLTNTDKYEAQSELPEGTSILIPKKMIEKPHKFHQKPQACCADLAASGTHGSTIRLRPLPLNLLSELRFGPGKSKEKPLKVDKNGVPAVVSLSGFLRRMSAETREIFESVFTGESL